MVVSLTTQGGRTYDGEALLDSPRSLEVCRKCAVSPRELLRAPPDDDGGVVRAEVREFTDRFREARRKRLLADVFAAFRALDSQPQPSPTRSEAAKARRRKRAAGASGYSSPLNSPAGRKLRALFEGELRRVCAELRLAKHQEAEQERVSGVARRRREKKAALVEKRLAAEERLLQLDDDATALEEHRREVQTRRHDLKARILADASASRVQKFRDRARRRDRRTREARAKRVANEERSLFKATQEWSVKEDARQARVDVVQRAAIEKVEIARGKRTVLQQFAAEERARGELREEVRREELLSAAARWSAARDEEEERLRRKKQESQARYLTELQHKHQAAIQCERMAVEVARSPDPRSVAIKFGLPLDLLPAAPSPPKSRRPQTARPYRPRTEPPPPPTNLMRLEESSDELLRRLGLHVDQEREKASRPASGGQYFSRWLWNHESPNKP
eukprot:Hpha_TRINITY_DN8433_c0_g2::TRINITY_DN8433_c0_g2_i1::g.34867::m.34867